MISPGFATSPSIPDPAPSGTEPDALAFPPPRSHPLKPLLPITSILVVCDGNHCRSPIAEILLRTALGGRVTVSSAGLAALQGEPPAREAERLMRELNLDISAHRGRQLTQEMAEAVDLILVMDHRQKRACERIAPAARNRIFLLGHWQPRSLQEIPDPFGVGPMAFQLAREQISRAVADWQSHLAHTQRSA